MGRTNCVAPRAQVGLGAAYQADLEELVHGPAGTVPVDPAGTATACFIAAGIYVACLGLSSCQLWLRKKTFPHGEGDMQ